jgi:hypothetical protein
LHLCWLTLAVLLLLLLLLLHCFISPPSLSPAPPQGSVALYAVSVVLVVLLFCCSFVNYHFGATFLTLLLTVVTVLYLLLAFVIALIMVVLGDVCPATEDLILSFIPANMKDLVQ